MDTDEPSMAFLRLDPELLRDHIPFEVAAGLTLGHLRIGSHDGSLGGLSFVGLKEALTLTDDDRRFVDFLVRDAVTAWLAES